MCVCVYMRATRSVGETSLLDIKVRRTTVAWIVGLCCCTVLKCTYAPLWQYRYHTDAAFVDELVAAYSHNLRLVIPRNEPGTTISLFTGQASKVTLGVYVASNAVQSHAVIHFKPRKWTSNSAKHRINIMNA